MNKLQCATYTTMCDFSANELDKLFLNMELSEPKLNVGNPAPHVRLFATVGSPTDELVNEVNLALADGGNRVQQLEGGSGQMPSLSFPL